MARLTDLIPGLREAGESYRQAALEAFLGIEPLLCGMVIMRPFTPRMLIELYYAKNGYVCPRAEPILIEDQLQFLWRCSEKFSPNAKERRTEFWQACSLLEFVTVHQEINQYLARAMRFMPEFGRSQGEVYSVWSGALVDLIASEYGWTEDAIIDLPFVRLFQYAHRIFSRHDPNYKQMDPESAKLRVEFLKKLNNAGSK